MSNKNSIKLNELGIPEGMSAGAVMQEYNELRWKHIFYGVVSFLMSGMFYSDWLSPGWWDKTIEGGFDFLITQQGMFGIMGWAFSAVITILIMHSHTTNNKKLRMGAYSLVPLVVFMGLAFNTFTETASSKSLASSGSIVKTFSLLRSSRFLYSDGEIFSEIPFASFKTLAGNL